MIQQKLKLCKTCGKPKYIFSHGNCKWCDSKTKKPKGLKSKIKKPTGEKEVFLQIWKERPHICSNCKEPLGHEPLAHFFSHIVPKSRNESLRLDPDNILLQCWLCHDAWGKRGIAAFVKRTKE